MDKILSELQKDGNSKVSEIEFSGKRKLLTISFVAKSGRVSLAYTESYLGGNIIRTIMYPEEKRLFYTEFKSLSKLERVIIMMDLWRNYGEYNLMLALRKYSTEIVAEYGKSLFSYLFIHTDTIYTHDGLNGLDDKAHLDKSIFIAAIKMLEHKIKDNK